MAVGGVNKYTLSRYRYIHAVAEGGRNPVSKHRIQSAECEEYEQVGAGRDGRTTISRDQNLKHERGQGKRNRVELTTIRIGNLAQLIHALSAPDSA